MVAARISIVPVVSTAAIDPSVLRDLIYANARPESGVQHIWVRVSQRGADIVGFIDGDDLLQATETLRSIVDMTIGGTQLLRMWRVM